MSNTPAEPQVLPAKRTKTAAEIVGEWTKGVVRKKVAVERTGGVLLADMQKIADIAMYDGIVQLHGILQLDNTEESERTNPATGEKEVYKTSNIPYKIQAANGITAVQRYLLERSKEDNDKKESGTTIIFEDSQQITSPDGSQVVTVKKKSIERARVVEEVEEESEYDVEEVDPLSEDYAPEVDEYGIEI